MRVPDLVASIRDFFLSAGLSGKKKFLTDGNALRSLRLHPVCTDVTQGNTNAAMQQACCMLKLLFYLTISHSAPQNSAVCDRYLCGNTTRCLFTSGIDHLASLDNGKESWKVADTLNDRTYLYGGVIMT